MWKYQDGLHLGDVFYVDIKKLKKDTLFVNYVPKYILETSKGYFGFPTKLKLTDINSKEVGVYVGK